MIPVIFQNKQIGFIKGDTYFCERDRNHLFIKYENGLGLSLSVIDLAENFGAENVCINFENRLLLKCPMSFFYLKGIPFQFKYINKYTGQEVIDEQLILPNRFFNQQEVKERQEILA